MKENIIIMIYTLSQQLGVSDEMHTDMSLFLMCRKNPKFLDTKQFAINTVTVYMYFGEKLAFNTVKKGLGKMVKGANSAHPHLGAV